MGRLDFTYSEHPALRPGLDDVMQLAGDPAALQRHRQLGSLLLHSLGHGVTVLLEVYANCVDG